MSRYVREAYTKPDKASEYRGREYRIKAALAQFPSGFLTWHLLYLERSKSPQLLNSDDFLNHPEQLGKI